MDPLENLVELIAIYGILGLCAIGLAERFLPALPSHGVLVAIGVAADNNAWSFHTAIVATTIGGFIGAFGLYLLARAVGESRTTTLLYSVGGWAGLSPPRIDRTLSSLRDRERALTILSQLTPTIRLISPIAAGLLGTNTLRFVSGITIGIILWNSLFIAIGYVAVLAIPGVNASALALKVLALLVVAELLTALAWRLQRRDSASLTFGADK